MQDERTVRLARARSVKPRGRPKARLYDINELAEYLHVSRRTIYRMLDAKGLPYIRVGYVVRFNLPEVLAWLKAFTERGEQLTWQDDFPGMKRGIRRLVRPERNADPIA